MPKKTTTKTEVEFLNTRLPQYPDAVKALKNAGFASKRMTKGTRKEILEAYFRYLVTTKAMELGRSLSPKELEELDTKAKDSVEYYEMYIKQTKVPIMEVQENIAMNLPEEFATEENVEKMQNNYQMFANLSEQMRRSTISNLPSSVPSHAFAQSLLLNPEARITNWYNYKRSQGMKNSSSDDNMDGGRRRRSTRKRSTKKHKKTAHRTTRYTKRA